PSKLTAADERLAQEVLDYCLEVVDQIEGLDALLCHTADSIGRSVAVGQFIWDTVEGQRRPVAAEGIAGTQLRIESSDPTQLRIVTEDDTVGIPISTYPAGQFLVRQPRSIGGSYFRGGLLRGAVVGHMAKRVGRKSWWFGIEKFGMPVSIAKYDTADEATKNNILSMISSLGVARGGLFPKGCEFEFATFDTKGEWPHERLLAYVDAGYAKLCLGQTLTTQIGETGGAMAAATVHNEVREDLRDDDRASEARDVREQLLRPVVLYKFGERAMRFIPHFRRIVEEPQDDVADMATLKGAVNDLGFPVPMRHVVDRFGLPVVEGTDLDAALPGRAIAPSPFDLPPDLSANSARRDLRIVANRALDKILSRRSTLASIGPWLVGAILASQSVTERSVDAFDAALVPFNNVALSVDAGSLPADMADALADVFGVIVAGDSHADMVELNRQLLLATRLHGERTTQLRAERSRSRNVKTQNAESVDFAKLPFVEAIESLRDRVGLDPETFIQLDGHARSRAFRVAGVWEMDLLAVLHTNLLRTITNGETVRDFRLRVLPQMADRAGWTGESPWHADVVFYQNFAMAHAAGRFRQYEELDISYWRFRANGDSCEICKPEVGKVYRTTDTARIPPLHFNCDCIDEVVFGEELGAGELRESASTFNPALDRYRSKPSAFVFDVRQYGALEPLRINKYPAEFQPAFRRLADARGWEVSA
ncbi:MAG: DUF935 family protein, partial [Hyphomicrobiales bacterium]|nr:DUF935 family protein [Hyphomicrobiales bacterium]